MEIYDTLVQYNIFHSTIASVSLIIIPAFIGAYGGDYVRTLKHEDMKVSISRILLSTCVAFFIIQAVMEWLNVENKGLISADLCQPLLQTFY